MLKAAGIIKGNVKTDEDFNQPQSEFAKRHNVDLYRTGSFDICAGMWHFSAISWYLGVDFMKWGFPFV